MFSTGSMIKYQKVKNVIDAIKQVNKLYLQRGFKITHIHAGIEFEQLRAETADIGISLNCVSNKEHVPNIEWFNWTVKQGIRSARESMTSK